MVLIAAFTPALSACYTTAVIGTTLFHYQIIEKIGSVGMGEVCRARDTKLGRDVTPTDAVTSAHEQGELE